MNAATRLFLILIGLVLIAPVEMWAQTNDAPKWITLKPSEFKDSMVYRAQGDFGGKHYESIIYGHDLDGVTKWKPGEDLPISMSNIIAKKGTGTQQP